jgi:hypothetical protein
LYPSPNLITSLKIKYMKVGEPQLGEERLRNNEVMRLGIWGNSLATEVVLLGKSGGNEVEKVLDMTVVPAGNRGGGVGGFADTPTPIKRCPVMSTKRAK